MKHWTTKEIEIIKQLYPKGGTRAVIAAMPYRTRDSITSRARLIGIVCKGKPGAGNPLAYLNAGANKYA